jgi:arylsulfatase A-like enzyme
MLRNFQLLFLPFLAACSLWAADKPNIIVFLVDDMGLMDTSVPFLTNDAGEPVVHPLNEWYRTPNMARLAAQGTRFSTFYAQSVCSPTRATVMTGAKCHAACHHAVDSPLWK